MYPKELKAETGMNIFTPMFTAALFKIQKVETTQMPVNG